MSFRTFGVEINGVKTDIVIGDFSNQVLIIATQIKKFGPLIRIEKESLKVLENQEETYNIQTLFGEDKQDNQVVIRILMEEIKIDKPVLFSLQLNDYSTPTVKNLQRVLSQLIGKKVMVMYGQVIIGPPGSGKTTYCHKMSEFLADLGRNVSIINLDPANDLLCYKPSIDISELVTVEDVMDCFHMGPNGALVYSMKFLEENIDWLVHQINKLEQDAYLMIDCPGQVELYTHYNCVKNVIQVLENHGCKLCVVHLVDTHYCNDPGKYISALLLSLCTMMQMELPHVNVLSKMDLLLRHAKKLAFNPEYYTEVLELSYLLDMLDADPLLAKYKRLNKSLISIIEDSGLVSFVPLNVKDKQTLLKLRNTIDGATGYIFGSKEENKNIQKLLSVAMGETEEDHQLREKIQNDYLTGLMADDDECSDEEMQRHCDDFNLMQ